MTVAEITAALRDEEFSLTDLEDVVAVATARLENDRTNYAKTFELGDVVRLNTGEVVTVARRNVHTVTVMFRDGSLEKVAPENIVGFIDADENGSFDYLNVFGNHVEETEEAL